jgi:hypothetical protein
MVDTHIYDTYNTLGVENVHLIQAEIKVPQSVLFCVLIGASLWFRYALSTFTAICFALASLCLLLIFSLMPYLQKIEYIKIENEYFPNYVMIQREWAVSFARYVRNVKIAYRLAVFLVVLGVIGLIIVY